MSDSGILKIVAEPLSAISFVQDYVEFHFDGKIVRALSGPTVTHKKQTIHAHETGWRDALCALIGMKVSEVILDEEDRALLILRFAGNAEVKVSLSQANRTGPEALHYVPGDNQPIEVWQPA